jgi:hypothetical protein
MAGPTARVGDTFRIEIAPRPQTAPDERVGIRRGSTPTTSEVLGYGADAEPPMA